MQRLLVYATQILMLANLHACSGASSGVTPTVDSPEASSPSAKTAGNDASRPKSNWPPDDPTSPDLRGQGWYCHDARDEVDSISLCHRTEQQCERSRNESAGVYETSSCRFQNQAACMFAMDAGTGKEFAICVNTVDECKRHSMTLLSRPEIYKFVSTCEPLD